MRFTQDNGGCNDIPFTKITVEINEKKLEIELKNFFGWRKNNNKERLLAQGSYNYDRFIKHLSSKGYAI